jgi:squalene synthase HpnC
VVNASVPTVLPDEVDRAYDACTRLAREHYENFPVASVLVPRRMRRGVSAVYAFARRADDFADEPGYSDAERLRLLDDWQQRLTRAVAGPEGPALQEGQNVRTDFCRAGASTFAEAPADKSAPAAGVASGFSRKIDPSDDDRIFIAVADAMQRHDLPVTLLSDLLSAFRQDVTVKRYAAWDDVLDYCARSANPVGRLVLRIAGHRDDALDRASDALCTALQLTNFWQDFARDWANGRLYVPLADRDACGAREADLDRAQAASRAATGSTPSTAVPMPPEWRAVLREMAQRTRRLFAEGRPVCDGVRGRLKYELRLTWLGGSRILDRLERADFAAFAHRPTLTARDIAPLVWRTAAWIRPTRA